MWSGRQGMSYRQRLRAQWNFHALVMKEGLLHQPLSAPSTAGTLRESLSLDSLYGWTDCASSYHRIAVTSKSTLDCDPITSYLSVMSCEANHVH